MAAPSGTCPRWRGLQRARLMPEALMSTERDRPFLMRSGGGWSPGRCRERLTRMVEVLGRGARTLGIGAECDDDAWVVQEAE